MADQNVSVLSEEEKQKLRIIFHNAYDNADFTILADYIEQLLTARIAEAKKGAVEKCISSLLEELSAYEYEYDMGDITGNGYRPEKRLDIEGFRNRLEELRQLQVGDKISEEKGED